MPPYEAPIPPPSSGGSSDPIQIEDLDHKRDDAPPPSALVAAIEDIAAVSNPLVYDLTAE